MLETTLATSFVPGTNIKGQVAGANWIFALPSLEFKRVVCLGLPQPASLRTLASFSDNLAVLCRSSQQEKEIQFIKDQIGLRSIWSSRLQEGRKLEFQDESVDLIVVEGWHVAKRIQNSSLLYSEILRILTRKGLVYLDYSALMDHLLGRQSLVSFGKDFSSRSVLWVTPLSGEAHSAIPTDDSRTIDYFKQRGLNNPSLSLRKLEWAEKTLDRWLLSKDESRRYSAVYSRNGSAAAGRPPEYLRSIASQSGIKLDNFRWGLSAKGEYSSRKILFLLFDQEANSPKYIVKMVRDPAYNARLENEYQALKFLHEKGIGGKNGPPQAVFFGHHKNLAILGETVIEGTAFKERTKWNADCPLGLSAIQWLVKLGTATAHPTSTSVVANGLWQLFEQFNRVYQPNSREKSFLDDQITAISRCGAEFPLVFQHGDPGAWNVFSTPDGKAVFLDWEAAEPNGMPLWDLFYFVRSFGVGIARKNGVANSLKGFRQQLMEKTSVSDLLIKTVDSYSEACRLPYELVKPVFYTCWMHRALKEVTRLSPAKLQEGSYFRLLQLCIQQDDAPGLQRLFKAH